MLEKISSGSLMPEEMCVIYLSLIAVQKLMVRSCISQSQTVSAAGPTVLTLLCFLNYYATITSNQLKNWQILQQDQ